jgi:MurNAc alpha-1-phosphate uridylyltransferase
MGYEVAILAGGLATRLHPMTENIPKALVPVWNTPFVDYQLRLLKDRGVDRVVFCLGHLGHMVREHLADGGRFGLSVTYSDDGEKPLGTGGALRKAANLVCDYFGVLYGDSFLDMNYRGVFELAKSRNCSVMTVFKNEGKWDASNVEFADGVVQRYSKRSSTLNMKFIDYGFSVLRKTDLLTIDAGQRCDLADLLERLSISGELLGIEAPNRFFEIGSKSGLDEFADYLLQHKGKPPEQK